MPVDKECVPADLTRVNLAREWEVSYWCARFDVGPDELRACVTEVGPRVDDVERRLRNAARKSFDKMGED